MKKSLPVILGLLLINFVSAYNGYSSLSNFLNRIEPSTLILAALFLIFFAFLYYVLSKIFRNQYNQPNKAIAGVIALGMSILIIYGINQAAWDIENFFYRLNISLILVYAVGGICLILILWAIFRKKKPKDWRDEYYKTITKGLKKKRR